jgi:acetylornithine deacetylase/succinyl-diaminopimelate desuccinylase-like protein
LTGVPDDVAALGAIVRDSAGAGEWESGELIARRLRDVGAQDVRVEPFRFQRSWGPRHALHFGAGIAAAAARRPALALAALASFDAEFSGRSQWLARVLPSSTGANVVARLPARGGRRRTLVLVAHHDAAQTGFLWRNRWLSGPDVGSRAAAQELAFLLAAAPSRRLRALGAGLLGVGVAAALDVARSPTVPGASDNATGVAAVIELMRRFAADPPHRCDVVAVVPGAEESGMGGMRAWLQGGGARLDPGTTLVLGLDTLGAGEPVVLGAEGPPRAVRYRDEDLAWADRGAARAGLERPERIRLGGWTDPALAALAGLPAISLLSMRDRSFTNYHLPTDTPDRVDWDSVEACLRLADATAREWAEAR